MLVRPEVLEDPRGRARRRDVFDVAAAGGGHDGAGGGAHRVILHGILSGQRDSLIQSCTYSAERNYA